MKNLSLYIFLFFAIILVVLPWASGHIINKRGVRCPSISKCQQKSKDRCQRDSDCSSRNLCCNTGCNMDCLSPIEVDIPSFDCPSINWSKLFCPSSNKNQCQRHNECGGGGKCCSTGCKYECVGDNKGSSWFPFPFPFLG